MSVEHTRIVYLSAGGVVLVSTPYNPNILEEFKAVHGRFSRVSCQWSFKDNADVRFLLLKLFNWKPFAELRSRVVDVSDIRARGNTIAYLGYILAIRGDHLKPPVHARGVRLLSGGYPERVPAKYNVCDPSNDASWELCVYEGGAELV